MYFEFFLIILLYIKLLIFIDLCLNQLLLKSLRVDIVTMERDKPKFQISSNKIISRNSCLGPKRLTTKIIKCSTIPRATRRCKTTLWYKYSLPEERRRLLENEIQLEGEGKVPQSIPPVQGQCAGIKDPLFTCQTKRNQGVESVTLTPSSWLAWICERILRNHPPSHYPSEGKKFRF